MVQKTDRPQRGRPPRFDEGDVVAGALIAFWSHGYEGTTLAELERATGVDRSTIYNSFGGKRGLYDRAADGYVSGGERHLFSPLSDGTAGIEDIVEYLDRLEAIQLDGAMPSGCLIINDLADPTSREMTDRYLHDIGNGLSNALERSNGVDGTDPSANAMRGESLLAAIVGVNLTHRRDPPAASSMMNGLRELVRSWATRQSPSV